MTIATQTIRAMIGFSQKPDMEVVMRAYAVQKGMTGNPSFSNSPVDTAVVFKAAIDGYAEAIQESLSRSVHAIAAREKKREEVVRMLRQLGQYVEHACNGDMTVFLSSGFTPLATTRSSAPPIETPSINRLDQGQSGELLVNVKPVRGARNYEVRYAELGGNGTAGAWNVTVAAKAKSAISVSALNPGTVYTFQVRAFGLAGHTGWSEPSSRMAI
jgi:hypothetical protein